MTHVNVRSEKIYQSTSFTSVKAAIYPFHIRIIQVTVNLDHNKEEILLITNSVPLERTGERPTEIRVSCYWRTITGRDRKARMMRHSVACDWK